MDPKIQEALDLIQDAQNTMYTAAQKLCSVQGMADAWGKTCHMGQKIKAHWHTVNNRAIALRAKAKREVPA